MRRFWNLFRRHRLERDIAEELATHAALLAEANRTNGTQRRLGSDLALRERTRAADVPLWLDELLRDLDFARRSLWRSRGFTLVAVATLALGIGATTAMYSVVRTVVLDPVPFPDAQRLVSIERSMHRYAGTDSLILTPVIEKLRQAGIFASMATGGGLGRTGSIVYIHGFATPKSAFQVSRNWFPTLGVRLALGRNFGGRRSEAIVSYAFFQHELSGSRSALGEPLRIGNRLYTVVGVLAAGQEYPPRTDVWVPGRLRPDSDGWAIARLPAVGSPLAARARAEAAVAAIGRQVRRDGYGPDDIASLTLGPLPFSWSATPEARTALWVLLSAAVCLLLIASANTANLLLARGLERNRELAVRRALGASRWRLLRLLLAEGLWLALLGGLGGTVLAGGLVRLARLGPATIPRLNAVHLNLPVLEFAVVVALLCGLTCALAPALRFSGRASGELDPLHAGEQLTGTHRVGNILIASEVALTVVLLAGGLLLARSLSAIRHVDPGFQPAHVTSVRIFTPSPGRGTSQRRRDQFRRQELQADEALNHRLAALRGASSSGFANIGPFYAGPLYAGALAGAPAYGEIIAGPGYFRTLRIPLLAGRAFTAADLASNYHHQALPVIINAAMARELWPARAFAQAIGEHLQWLQTPEAAPDPVVVVGVVGSVNDRPGKPAPPRFYSPYFAMGSVDFFVRSSLPPGALAAALRTLLSSTASGLTLAAPQPLEGPMQAALGQPRFRAALMAAFAALAWVLALVGLFGVLAFHVRQRRREIGVRMALGANEGAVVRLILGQSAAMLGAGIGAGWLLAWLLARYVASLLFGVGVFDPVSWLGAGAALLAAGLLASLIPARRALRIDAAETLRCE